MPDINFNKCYVVSSGHSIKFRLIIVSVSSGVLPKIGLSQQITKYGDGCKILNVQFSLGRLANSPNAPWEKFQKIIPSVRNYLSL